MAEQISEYEEIGEPDGSIPVYVEQRVRAAKGSRKEQKISEADSPVVVEISLGSHTPAARGEGNRPEGGVDQKAGEVGGQPDFERVSHPFQY